MDRRASAVRAGPATAGRRRRSCRPRAAPSRRRSTTRSFISVVCATFQPSPTSPSRWSSGIRTSVKKTSLNSASPVSWRSGRTSTPGAVMSSTKYVRPWCFGTIGIGTGDQDGPPRLVGHRRPHLLAVDDPVTVAGARVLAYRPGRQAGEVGAGARLAEELAPDLLAGPQRTQPALALLVGAVAQDRSAPPCRARCRSGAGRCPARPRRRTPRRRPTAARGARRARRARAGTCTHARPASNRARRNSILPSLSCSLRKVPTCSRSSSAVTAMCGLLSPVVRRRCRSPDRRRSRRRR